MFSRWRSAVTGRFVRRSTAERHPRETVGERRGHGSEATFVYFLHDDMVAFTAAIVAEQSAPVPPTSDFDEYLEDRLSRWERGTWPR